MFADWLIEQGNPRGEWIALHHKDTEEAELERRALWQVHGAAWRAEDVGAVELGSLDAVIYRDGFLDEVRFEQPKLDALAPMLATQPIRSLSVFAITDLGALAKLPVLETVETLDLGYGIEKSNPDELLAVLDATPRLKRLALSPHQDVPWVWAALERFARLGTLESLDVASLKISSERAMWMATALSSLTVLRCDRSLTGSSLRVLAENATFALRKLYLSDHDGEHGRTQLLDDAALAAVLKSPFVRGLDVLSLFGCGKAAHDTAEALAELPCAPRLTSLDLGSIGRTRCAEALDDCTFPMLEWLNIRHNNLGDDVLQMLARFPGLKTLRVEKNAITREGAETVLGSLPVLERLSIGDNPLGDSGVLAVAWSDHVTALRHLDLDSTQSTGVGTEGLVDGGKLLELRSLGLACNELDRKTVTMLADGPFDKLAVLGLSYATRGNIAPLFAHAWMPAEESGEDMFQRRLELSGQAVPHKLKSKKAKAVLAEADVRDLDTTSTYKKGDHVKHSEYGVGVVEKVATLSLDVKFPRKGKLRFPHTPSEAIPFDQYQRFEPHQVILHPTFGAGLVLTATADRIEVEFGVSGKKTMVHGRT